MNTPGFIIAGTSRQCGKTTTAMGLMAALKKRGLVVQGYKVGPDLADPILHAHITSRAAINLDSWTMGPKRIRYIFSRHAELPGDADMLVIEGAQGLYDGEGMTSQGSTADVAKIINRPIVLIFDVKECALSAAAMIRGFLDFDREVPIKAVIFNNVNSQEEYSIMKDAIEKHTGIDVIGYLPTREKYSFEDKSIGLITDKDAEEINKKLNELVIQIEQTVNVDALLELAQGWDTDTSGNDVVKAHVEKIRQDYALADASIRIGVAWDKAFCYYYQDNFDLLADLGVEIVKFSPLRDDLPKNLNGLYFGGGYPEIYAHGLERNQQLREDIKAFVEAGGPVYAECGGLMYLCSRLLDYNGFGFDMAGVLNMEVRMRPNHHSFGYVDIELRRRNILGSKGQRTKGYEYHHCEAGDVRDDNVEMTFKVFKDRATTLRQWPDGYQYKNLLAAFPHTHFYTNLNLLGQYLKNCAGFQP